MAAPIAALVLNRTAGVCRRHALTLAGLALLAVAPPMLLLLGLSIVIQAGWVHAEIDPALDLGVKAMLTLWGLLTVIQLGAVTSGTLRAVRGEPFGFGAALGEGFRRSPAVLVASLVAGIAVFAGLAVMIAPGAVAFAALSLGVPAVVEERIGPHRALVRSLDLTRDARAGLFGSLTLISAIALVATWGPIAATVDGSNELVGVAYPFLVAFFAQVPAVGCAVAYSELRDRKEGRPTAELAKVFE